MSCVSCVQCCAFLSLLICSLSRKLNSQYLILKFSFRLLKADIFFFLFFQKLILSKKNKNQYKKCKSYPLWVTLLSWNVITFRKEMKANVFRDNKNRLLCKQLELHAFWCICWSYFTVTAPGTHFFCEMQQNENVESRVFQFSQSGSDGFALFCINCGIAMGYKYQK